MQIATDGTGKVILVGQSLPTDWNGIALAVRALSPEQETAYLALPTARAGVMFDGQSFAAIPLPPPSAEEVRLGAIDTTIAADTFGGKTIPELKAMSKDELAAWWAPIAPGTVAGVNAILFKIIRLLLRRVF